MAIISLARHNYPTMGPLAGLATTEITNSTEKPIAETLDTYDATARFEQMLEEGAFERTAH